jgi:hypothetical protein
MQNMYIAYMRGFENLSLNISKEALSKKEYDKGKRQSK